jgi:signal transduction histidine kinase
VNASALAQPIRWERLRESALFALGLGWCAWIDVKSLGVEGGDDYTVWGDMIVGVLMQWTGLLVWRRPGTGRTGPLLYLAGILWFVGSGMPEPFEWLTFPGRGWYEPILVAIVVGFPTGHLVRRADKVIVGTLIVAYAVRSLSRYLFWGDSAPFPNEDLWGTIEGIVVAISGVVGVALVVVCSVRWRRATGPARRTLTPVLISGIAIAPMLGWSALTTPTNFFSLPMPDPIWIIWFHFVLRSVVPIALLVGTYRLQSARSSIADLLLELDRGVPIGRLEELLRRQLRDPSVRLVFPRDGPGYVDAEGDPVALPVASDGSAVTRIDGTDGTAITYIVHDPALAEDPELVRAAGAAARLSLENERLQAEVRAQLKEVRELSARLVDASDAERRRVERDLHDGAQQRLVTLALRLQAARLQAEVPDADLVRMLTEASIELDEALQELRELARGIHPAILSRSGLAAAVTALAERSTVPVTISVSDRRFTDLAEVTAYFVIAEALTNLARHASAGSASIAAEVAGDNLVVVVSDDGVGGASLEGGSGLSGLRDRVLAIGGSIAVESPPDGGTRIRAVLPCA